MNKVVLVILCFLVFLSCDDSKEVEIIEFGLGTNYTLNELINDQISKSKVPIVYFYADWCAPCKKFSKALKNTLLKQTLNKTVLIKVNVDNNEELAISYSVSAIPTFIKAGKNGVVKASITSGEWKEDIPENIAPIMSKLIYTQEYDK
ncbi:thioredoxin family protein [Lacinutrix mariniflava]|uniref:thioredoxin family protein n=1 Tax=Lacinutrix mariniflava TaxID=342955 RepID=UPI0006E31B84|nr:thioredoxin family protein [Lacinutrix mariniflava]